MVSRESVIAATRFGYGEPPEKLAKIGANPRNWLLAQLQNTSLPGELAKLPGSAELIQLTFELRKQQRKAKKNNTRPDQPVGRTLRKHYLSQAFGRTSAAIHSNAPFRERLVQFWNNHFAVSVDKPQLLAIAGCYENEAIRPNLTGSFKQLLTAAVQHPAMLLYLDNWQSIGPNSRLGKRRDKGINENLAREILELHTLGVDGGYQQSDVIALAKALTGWTIGGSRTRRSSPHGKFHFFGPAHEPGKVMLLGNSYRQSDRTQGEAILDDLARHPATARHIATKLYRHFIADEVDRQAVSRLSDVFAKTDGDLMALYRELVNLEQCWLPRQQKFKTPNDLVISTYRSLELPVANDKLLLGVLTELNQPPYKPGSPAGWPEQSSHWDGGAMLMKRIEWIDALSDRTSSYLDPVELSSGLLGPLLSDHTLTAIKRAESPAQGLALLLLSPEFQRR